MKTKLTIIIFSVFIFYSCTNDVNTVGPDSNSTSAGKIIFLSSFESNGIASWEDWINPGPPVVKITNEPAPNGGSYSIFLKAKNAGAIVFKTIPANEGKHKYTLIFWSRSTQDPGSLDIYLKRGTQEINSKRQKIIHSDWTEYKIDTEFTAVQGDSIEIFLSGSAYQTPQGFTYFDLIQLKRMD